MEASKIPADLKPITDVIGTIIQKSGCPSRSVFSDLVALMFHFLSANQPDSLAILRKYDPLAILGPGEKAIMSGKPDCNYGEKITDYFWMLICMLYQHIAICRPGALGELYKALAVDESDSSEDINREGDSLLIFLEGETAGNNNPYFVYHHSNPDYVRINAINMCILRMAGLVVHCTLDPLEARGMWVILPDEKKDWNIRKLPFEQWPEVYRRRGIRPSDDVVQ